MTDKAPFEFEILGFKHDCAVVLDRAVSGSVYLEEAKRIGRHFLSIVEGQTSRIPGLPNEHQLVFTWRSGDSDGSSDLSP